MSVPNIFAENIIRMFESLFGEFVLVKKNSKVKTLIYLNRQICLLTIFDKYLIVCKLPYPKIMTFQN